MNVVKKMTSIAIKAFVLFSEQAVLGGGNGAYHKTEHEKFLAFQHMPKVFYGVFVVLLRRPIHEIKFHNTMGKCQCNNEVTEPAVHKIECIERDFG